jgi:hypothetical protein
MNSTDVMNDIVVNRGRKVIWTTVSNALSRLVKLGKVSQNMVNGRMHFIIKG